MSYSLSSKTYKGFTLSADLQDKVVQMVSSADWNPETATEIPDSNGMVLVKCGSAAFHERRAAKGIFMIPVSMTGTSCGAKVELLCFVCTK
jgi:hypothetical protein